MQDRFTVEELLLDETFIDYCQERNSIYRMKWEALISENAQLQKTVAEAKEMLSMLSPVLNEQEIRFEIEKLKDQLQSRGNGNELTAGHFSIDESYHRPQKRRRSLRVMALACIGVAVLGTGAYFLQKKNAPPPSTVLSLYKTEMGERKKMTLPDGSVVILNSGSRLSLVGDFNNKERRLRLEGMGYFQVAKNPEKPFIVETGQFTTTAVGTAFYVDASSPKSHYSVILTEGRVKLANGKQEPTFLSAGEKATWTPSGAGFVTTVTDTTGLQQWLQGELTLNRTSAADAFGLLEKWYGVTIEDKRTNKPAILLSGTYHDQPLEDVLKVITFTLSCNYSITDKKIIIQ